MARFTGKRHGVTLVELVVSMSILAVITVPFGFVVHRSTRGFSALAQRSQAVSRATALADRLISELSNGRLLSPANPDQSPTIRFDRIVDVVDGAPVYGDPIQIDLLPMESSNTDGVDNDGDGIIDEGAIRYWVDASPQGSSPGSEDVAVIISESVAKDGLQFTQVGGMIVLDLTLVFRTTDPPETSTVYIGSGALMN